MKKAYEDTIKKTNVCIVKVPEGKEKNRGLVVDSCQCKTKPIPYCKVKKKEKEKKKKMELSKKKKAYLEKQWLKAPQIWGGKWTSRPMKPKRLQIG